MSIAEKKLKPDQYSRLHANSVVPVVQAVRKLAARQVIKHGESGKLQDLINYVMLALTQEKYQTGDLNVDALYQEGKVQFKYAIEHGELEDGFAAKF